ncbi:MAG: hypothetical protein IIB67_08670 [Proteobacteria bacterium]|nr:hypothetical protein [Pseudomonadota bacterium]
MRRTCLQGNDVDPRHHDLAHRRILQVKDGMNHAPFFGLQGLLSDLLLVRGFLGAVLESDGRPPLHLHEEAREVGWSDEQLIEAVAQVALNEFQSLIANAAALPQDQSDPAMLPSAA